MTEEKELLFEIKDKIATITINRPKRKNAMNPAVMAALKDSFEQAGADPDVSAIVLTGAGGSFCAGADLGDTFGKEKSFLEMHEDRRYFAGLMAGMNKCRKPILAAATSTLATAKSAMPMHVLPVVSRKLRSPCAGSGVSG